jgi:hypothetical protein
MYGVCCAAADAVTTIANTEESANLDPIMCEAKAATVPDSVRSRTVQNLRWVHV